MSPSQREHRTDRTAETRPAPARGPAPAERTALLDVQRTLGNAAALHLLRQSGHAHAGPAHTDHEHTGHAHTGAERAGDVPVQRFMEPRASGEAGAWRQAALTWVQSDAQRILAEYAQVGLGKKLNKKQLDKLLADLGIEAAWQTVTQAVKNGPASAGEGVDASLTTVVQNLNMMEQECATAAKAGEEADYANPLPDAVVGTEFTFTDATLNGTAGGNPLRVDIGGLTGQEDARARAAITYAKGRMNDWTARVRAATLPVGFSLAVSDTTVKGQDAKKFTYSNGSTQWWWEITMDDACLETRTDPTPVAGLHAAHVRFIMRSHIFPLAEATGLHVDQSIAGGGGHLSLDSTTTFGGSVELFVQSMREWETQWEDWVARFGAAPREKDVVNAPWTGDLPQGETHLNGVRTVLDEILDDAHRGDVDLPGAIRRLQAHLQALPLHRDATQNLRNKVADHPEDRLHYQAVNLEHMADANAGSRRVEFRDIQAQDGYDQLIEDLRYIGSMLQGVRDNVRAEQQTRLAQRHP
ncbi:hypothetical protein ACIOEZ_01415 [Streptomyces sp. NPDC087866]|uniref:hypothetical protein n=1 Tax=unclassified Streptomyces TaxID=2593676 RepID=UPI00224DA906|nr:hypothetical protein [Streptomyces sp. NBC_01789]MCX4447578.1 hypothetical protein [Streptomyces sp. NBC_01789]